jgi:hypothetical protein
MTGSSVDYIVIPIIAVIGLIVWLGGVYYADSHPRWRGRGRSDVRAARRE